MLACAVLGGALYKQFSGLRERDPQRAENITIRTNNAATMIGAVASVVSIILKALWGQQVSAPAPSMRRIGEVVGEAA